MTSTSTSILAGLEAQRDQYARLIRDDLRSASLHWGGDIETIGDLENEARRYRTRAGAMASRAAHLRNLELRMTELDEAIRFIRTTDELPKPIKV